jgi:putative tricarboxylic transport membrane protein
VKVGRDRIAGAGWMVLGAAIAVASWRMDRLAAQNINPWSAPGLVPGLLGALMLLFGAALCLRGAAAASASDPAAASPSLRAWLALVLCIGFAAGLLGHGLPFWLTAAGFMFVAIFAFRWLDGDAALRRRLGYLAISSAAIAAAASVSISLLFQELFLIRLP